MPVISDSAIATVARAQGLSPTNVAIAVAVALAESKGNTNAHNPIGLDNSYGLWQINMLGDMGPDRRRKLGLTSNEQLYDPVINAKAMAMISEGGKKWSDWTTYTRGTYRTYMARGMAASGATSGSIETIPVENETSSNAITAFFDRIQDPRFWKFVAILAVGAFLVLIGIMKTTGDGHLSGVTKNIVKGAVGLVPGGGTVVKGVETVTGG